MVSPHHCNPATTAAPRPPSVPPILTPSTHARSTQAARLQRRISAIQSRASRHPQQQMHPSYVTAPSKPSSNLLPRPLSNRVSRQHNVALQKYCDAMSLRKIIAALQKLLRHKNATLKKNHPFTTGDFNGILTIFWENGISSLQLWVGEAGGGHYDFKS